MKKYFIIIGILIVVLLITVGFFVKTVLFTEGRYYDDVDTGIKAEIDTENDIKDNYRYDYLIIEGKQYSLVQKDNYLLHASETLLLPLPFGPTTAVSPLLKLSFVLSANDLKPCMSTDFISKFYTSFKQTTL